MKDVIKIGDWFYTGDSINEFEINCPIDYIPDSLNKYYSMSKNNVDALINTYVYVNHPMQFNDPYDSVRQFTYDDTEEDGFSKFNLMFVNMGLISMSESDTNMLMWAHYSNHDGFLINFNMDRLKDKFQFIFPMHYTDYFPDMRLYDKDHMKLMISTNLKSLEWSYEKEWRLYYSPGPMILPEISESFKRMNEEWFFKANRKPIERKVYYDIDDLNFITLGYKFIIGELHEKIDESTILFNVNDPDKKKLIEFLIKRKIKTKMISYGEVSRFGLKAIPIEINRAKDYDYYIKYIA